MTEMMDRFLYGINSNYVELSDAPVCLPFGVKHAIIEVTDVEDTEEDAPPFARIYLRLYSPMYAGESAMELFDIDHGDVLETASIIKRNKDICFDDMGLVVYLDDIGHHAGFLS